MKGCSRWEYQQLSKHFLFKGSDAAFEWCLLCLRVEREQLLLAVCNLTMKLEILEESEFML